MKVAIAVTTKNPLFFETWLDHHRRIGIEHFFIRVEESPDLCETLSKCPDVTLTADEETCSQHGVEVRQCSNATYALRESQPMGITHVLHIDDDELLFYPSGFDAFRVHVNDVTTPNIQISNHEAYAPSIDVVNPFLECCDFETNPYCFRAHGWGKCMGIVGKATYSMNPHSFYGYFTAVPPEIAIIRHYDSIPYKRWLIKMTRYSDANVVSNFPFVNESVRLLQSQPSQQALEEFWASRTVNKA